MNVRRTMLIGAVGAALVLPACGSGGGTSAPDDTPFEVPGEPVATTQVALPKSYRFEPAIIEIVVGETVTWTNEDDFPHTVHLLDGSDRSVDLPIGESASITFPDLGVTYYECSIHPQMRGKILVKEG